MRVEVVVPVEVGMSTARVMKLDHHQNQLALRDELEFVLEKREEAGGRMETSKSKMKAAYDRNTMRRKFGVGDWILRQAGALKKTRKLEANWERPYKVITVL